MTFSQPIFSHIPLLNDSIVLDMDTYLSSVYILSEFSKFLYIQLISQNYRFFFIKCVSIIDRQKNINDTSIYLSMTALDIRHSYNLNSKS